MAPPRTRVCEASKYPWEKTRSGTTRGYCRLTQIEFDVANMGGTGAVGKGGWRKYFCLITQMNEPSKTELVYVTYIRTTPRALWNALTQAKFTRQYYVGLELKAELKRGGRFDYMHRAELHGRPGAGVEGAVIEVNPRKKLVHSFEPKFIEDGPSRVTYEIEPMGMVYKLTVTHDQFPRGGATVEAVKEGWPEILSSLKSLLETGEALVIPRNP